MGLEVRKPMVATDGSAHLRAYDTRPVVGGLVIVHAYQDAETVSVAPLRQLQRSVQAEGALKGVMITTAGFGRACYEFANGKPLELISGPSLLSIMAEYLPDRKVRILGVDHDTNGQITNLPLN